MNSIKLNAVTLLVASLFSLSTLSAATAQTPSNSNLGSREDYIVGGTEANPGEFPWIARLSRGPQTACGGALIHRLWILTAAHCVNNPNSSGLTVTVGEHNTTVDEGTEQRSAIAEIVIHYGYDLRLKKNDIALVRLATPVQLSDRVQIMKLAPPPDAGTVLKIIGWGTTSSGGRPSRILRKADVPLVSNRQSASTNCCHGTGKRHPNKPRQPKP